MFVALNCRDFLQGELIEVNKMVGRKSMGLCGIDAEEDDVKKFIA